MMELFSKKVKCQRQKVTLNMFDKVVSTPLKPFILKLYFYKLQLYQKVAKFFLYWGCSREYQVENSWIGESYI